MIIAPDKIKHIVAGFAVALVVGIIFLIVGFSVINSAVAGLIAAVIVGAAKEAYDEWRKRKHNEGNGWDWYDFSATIIGGIADTIIIINILGIFKC